MRGPVSLPSGVERTGESASGYNVDRLARARAGARALRVDESDALASAPADRGQPVDFEAQSGLAPNSAGPCRLLLIEDNVHYAAGLRNNLEIEGFEVDLAYNGATGLDLIRTRIPALVILDVMLPGRDGYEILRRLRDNAINVPVVILTARRDEFDKLRGFGLGADDFITKPVSILELIARIRAVLRRAHPGLEHAPHWIRCGDIDVHPASRTVRRRGEAIDLTPKEFDLLLALLRHEGMVVPRQELLRDVWGYQADTVSRTLDTHMASLRQKLEDDPLTPRYFATVRSVGYMMRRPPPG